MNPEMEVIHTMSHPSLRGYDKVGAFLIFNKNRSWWTGSVMDDIDCSSLLEGKYGPTVIQVAAGVYAGFLYCLKHENKGTSWPDWCDTDFVLERAMPYLGRFISQYKDLTNTALKDCYKFESFLNAEKNDKMLKEVEEFYKRKII